MDPLINVAGMMRAVSEVRAVVRWVRQQSTAVVVSGVSMGSPVAALVSHLERQVDAVALYTPILGLNAMISRHLGRWGASRAGFRELLASEVVSALTSVIDPLEVEPAPPPDRRLIVGACTTGWRCASPPLPCSSAGAASSTGMTAATSDISSRAACRRFRSGSCAPPPRTWGSRGVRLDQHPPCS